MKYEGLEVVERDSARGSAEYLYKGVRISKYTQERGHKTRRGGYSRAGVKFTYKVHNFRFHAIIATSYRSVKNYTLKETIAEIDAYLNQENVIADRGEIINGVSERELFRSRGEYNG